MLGGTSFSSFSDHKREVSAAGATFLLVKSALKGLLLFSLPQVRGLSCILYLSVFSVNDFFSTPAGIIDRKHFRRLCLNWDWVLHESE